MTDSSILVTLLGHTATLLHGDTLVLDRWAWLKKRLARTRNAEKLLDVGCGSGAFSIGAALRGYDALGLSWDERNQRTATARAEICGARTARFEVLDVRRLHERADLAGQFDVAICLEVTEHVFDDRKLVMDIARTLKPGGHLLLTAPYLRYTPITQSDAGPFSATEDGGHVRRGYTRPMLEELCARAGLVLESQTFCSGYLSQKVTGLNRLLSRIHPLLGWGATLPLRILPPLFDRLVTRALGFPCFSICMEAYKPRFPDRP